jgi:hypothetical protein
MIPTRSNQPPLLKATASFRRAPPTLIFIDHFTAHGQPNAWRDRRGDYRAVTRDVQNDAGRLPHSDAIRASVRRNLVRRTLLSVAGGIGRPLICDLFRPVS